MIKLMITGENLKDLHKQILELGEEIEPTTAVTSQQANVETRPSVQNMIDTSPKAGPVFPENGSRSPEGNVISVGKEWKPVPGTSGYSGENLPAPNAAPVTPVALTPASEVDGAGVRWDKRIHSSSKALTVKGVWRTKRNLDPALLASVTAELTQAVQPVNIPPAPTPTVPVTAPPIQPAPVQPVMPVAQPPITQPTPVQPPVQTTQVVQPDATGNYNNVTIPAETKPAHSFATFKENLAMVMTSLVNDGKIEHGYLEQLNGHFGVSATWEIASDETKSLNLFEHLVTNGLITKVG